MEELQVLETYYTLFFKKSYRRTCSINRACLSIAYPFGGGDSHVVQSGNIKDPSEIRILKNILLRHRISIFAVLFMIYLLETRSIICKVNSICKYTTRTLNYARSLECSRICSWIGKVYLASRINSLVEVDIQWARESRGWAEYLLTFKFTIIFWHTTNKHIIYSHR